ncbi:MAG: hypothetical protein M3R68_06805 [Acidobacteriota bacterium]|nr:hypothetical protein [Acidobacteriota bacterium]
MAMAAVKESNDQKKVMVAVALGVLAIIALWWTFFGFGSSRKPPSPTPSRPLTAGSQAPVKAPDQSQPQSQPDDPDKSAYLTEIVLKLTPPVVPEARRNIFAFYEPTPTPVPQLPVKVPTPPPPPPVLLAAISPASVFARTDDFTLEATGDKFTPAVHIVIDGRELPTRYVSAQQVSATVPAAIIANAGQRQVSVKSSDGSLYSLPLSLSVNPPPVPNYNFIGLLGKKRNIGDTALLQDKSNKEVVSVQRGDILAGKFRVTSISDRELVLVDTNLKIKHLLTLTNDGEKGSFPQGRPTPKVAAEDDEP